MTQTRFQTGLVVATAGINADMCEDLGFRIEVSNAFERYCSCDWGDTDPEDAQQNDIAADNIGDRIFAGYKTSRGRIWIITEGDRSATTILYPDEY